MIAVVAVAILVVAGVGVGIAMTQQPEKKGLYKLDAAYLEIDMGGMAGTPKVIDTLEYMYKGVYGDLTDNAKKKTIADAKADTTFWDTYAKYTKIATRDGDTVTYKTVVNDSTTKTSDKVFTGKATKIIGTGSAYPYAAYMFICSKYNVKPFSSDADKNTDVKNEFQSLVYGGLMKEDIKTSSEQLEKLLPASYVEACSSIKSYKDDKMGQDVKNAATGGQTVFLMGSATIAADKNSTFVSVVETNGGHILLNNAKNIPNTLAMIDQLGVIMGYDDQVDKVIEDIQLRMYQIYFSAQEKNAANPDKVYKAYFEGSSGKASGKTSNGAACCKFFGWDTSLFDGAEHDTENLLTEKPNILMFYTNDSRSMDEKMRVTS